MVQTIMDKIRGESPRKPLGILYVQNLVTREDPETRTPRRLWVAYNEDGRAVDMVVSYAKGIPEGFNEWPALLTHNIRVEDFYRLQTLGTKLGILRNA
jgi:hypothetical protein